MLIKWRGHFHAHYWQLFERIKHASLPPHKTRRKRVHEIGFTFLATKSLAKSLLCQASCLARMSVSITMAWWAIERQRQNSGARIFATNRWRQVNQRCI
ncbi:MAG: hypothetical protein IPH54_14215 [Rhodoferax sp.]|nr:hypothetical protein [Rhodoferax sp.]